MLFESHSFLTPMSEVWPGGSLSKGKLQAFLEITIVLFLSALTEMILAKLGWFPARMACI